VTDVLQDLPLGRRVWFIPTNGRCYLPASAGACWPAAYRFGEREQSTQSGPSPVQTANGR